MENETNQNNPATSSIKEPADSSSETSPQEEGAIGAVIGSVIVVIILIVVGFYLWNTKISTPPVTPPTPVTQNIPTQPETSTAIEEDPATKALGEQSASVDLLDIEKDINTTNLNGLDKEMNDIGTETGL